MLTLTEMNTARCWHYSSTVQNTNASAVLYVWPYPACSTLSDTRWMAVAAACCSFSVHREAENGPVLSLVTWMGAHSIHTHTHTRAPHQLTTHIHIHIICHHLSLSFSRTYARIAHKHFYRITAVCVCVWRQMPARVDDAVADIDVGGTSRCVMVSICRLCCCSMMCVCDCVIFPVGWCGFGIGLGCRILASPASLYRCECCWQTKMDLTIQFAYAFGNERLGELCDSQRLPYWY